MKIIRETKAGQAISVHVVISKGEVIATVHSSKHYTATKVDVWDETCLIFQGKAKNLSEALYGAVIAGVRLTKENCNLPKPKGLDYYPFSMKVPKDYKMYKKNLEGTGYRFCTRTVGLLVLENHGMKVVKVL